MKLKQADISKIRKAMEKTLDKKRYEHTLGVAYTASCLAMCHEENVKNAELAGLLHDCAKCLPEEKLLSICETQHMEISQEEYMKPSLLHAKAGCYLAEKKYHIVNRNILNAIHNHTTGRPDMSLLEKIIFVADYIEPGRRQAPRLEQVRRTAFADLDQAVLMILEDTLKYLRDSGSVIEQTTQKTYQYYKDMQNSKQHFPGGHGET